MLGQYYKTWDGQQCDFIGALDLYTVGEKERMIETICISAEPGTAILPWWALRIIPERLILDKACGLWVQCLQAMEITAKIRQRAPAIKMCLQPTVTARFCRRIQSWPIIF